MSDLPDASFYTKQLESLIGKTIQAVVKDEAGEFFGLKIDDKVLWFLADAEGNEPGSFEIAY